MCVWQKYIQIQACDTFFGAKQMFVLFIRDIVLYAMRIQTQYDRIYYISIYPTPSINIVTDSTDIFAIWQNIVHMYLIGNFIY